MSDPTQHDVFWSKVLVAGPDECWPWQFGLRQGYGVFWNGSKNVAAHRHSVQIHGRAIPAGMVVDHICRNRACVNPTHLRIVTRFQNVHENSEAVAYHKAQQTHCMRGHALTGDNLRTNPRPGRRECRACNNQSMRDYRARKSAEREALKSCPNGFNPSRGDEL